MEAQQNITEHVVDDPLAPARLPALAQISDFWKRYDRLADIHDKKMTSNLNENLDVLLIFAALFSAINTTFISITMPDLFPNPSDETNTLLRLLVMRADNNTLTPADLSPPFSPTSTSIVVNCLLYASLSCSLLAAVGAMMSKEWLQSFDRTGQTGPLEDQGRFRQRKFDGVEQWHLEAVIKFLPNLLLLSVILFFAGIVLFLFPINIVVAGIVIAFSGLGVILSGISIIAGALSPLCPYQSAASSALLRTARALLSFWGALSPAKVLRIVKGMPGQVSRIFEITSRQCMHFLRDPSSAFTFANSKEGAKNKKENDKVVAAQAACWLLQTASNRSDQISAALFIRTLGGEAFDFASEQSGSSLQLVSSVRAAFDVWYNQPDARNQEVAELFGLALCHARLQSTEVIVQRNDSGDLRMSRSSSFGDTFLEVLERTTSRYASRRPEDEEYILHISFLTTILIRRPLIRGYQWAKLSRLILPPSTRKTADALLGLWVIFIGRMYISPTWFRELSTFEEVLRIGENEDRLAAALARVIYWSYEVLSSVQNNVESELSAAQGYTACLRRARERPSAGDRIQAARGVADLIWNYFDPLTTGSGPGETRWELVELSIEAVLWLRPFLDTNPGPDGSSTSGNPPSQQILNHCFIDALADIMLDDLQIPGWSTTKNPLKPSIVRILLWVWKNTPDTSIDDKEKDNIFVSSCRLFAPLEKEVEFSQRGEFEEDDKPLTSHDLNRIIEFIEYIMKGRKSSALITRNADVGINRLYVHFDKRADWEYELFDMRETSTLCYRSSYIGDGLL